MREKNIGFIFWVVCFGSFCYCSSNNEDSKSRQTFVIRYKDGEQTIPVTVVLDYKKQTEYVINMNPRTPAKSVTLYDFKQRTIAYKDLTNRECFLGRLTHETLNEETSALQDVKNPVEGKPKIRSLDPRTPALTPTEIRNIAGQKTAIFCRKMNTWLLMPERVHGINKREADHEYEERTYQYHGHRSSQYSHYEQETRRRYRNQSPAHSRRRSQRHKGAVENGNRPDVSETSIYPHNSNTQSSSSSYFNSNSSNSVPDTRIQNFSSSSLSPQKPYFSIRRDLQNDKEDLQRNNAISFENSLPSSRSHSSSNNFGYPNYGSRTSSSSGSSTYSRPSYSASNYFNSNETDDTSLLGHGQKVDIPKDTPQYFEHNRPLAQLISDDTTITTESSTDVPLVPRVQETRYPNVHPSLIHLLPLYKPLSQEFDFGTPSSLETGAPPQVNNQNYHQRNIESELHPFPSVHLQPDNEFIHLTNEHNTSQNPDVSINVLEIPRITKEFENTKINASYVPEPQQENVLENRNSVENYPSLSRTYFKSTPYFQRSNPYNTNITRSEHGSLSPDTNVNSVVRETYFNESGFHIPESYVSTTTILPVLTTPEYFVTDRTTSNTVYIPSVHTAFQNSEDFNSFQIFPSYIEDNPLSLERNLTAPSVRLRNDKFSDENSESITNNAFLTTEYPQTGRKHKTSSNHRSDIPSEESELSLHNHRVDTVSNAYPSLINSSTNEGLPPYRKRYENALRDFKPDEIVIDIENIPTHTLPPVTSSFQQKILTTIQPTVRSQLSGVIRSDTSIRSEQISGATTLRSFYTTTRYPRRRTNDKTRRIIQNGSISHLPKISPNRNYHHVIKNQPHINQLIGVNHYSSEHINRRQFHYPNRPQPPSQVRMPTELNQLHHFSQFNNLPPGVSVHPRHPQAPFAEMVHSNRPPTMPLVEDTQSPLKPHRQRHHRKKDRHLNSCCRLRGKSGAFQSCCRNGGPCCSRSRRRMQPPGSPCCASTKAIGQIIPANQIQPPARTTDQIVPPIRTEQVHRSDTGSKDRCEKEKMCRTLYESTQQVMVCRNAHIEGC